MRYTVRPISDRTRFTGEHRNSPFTADWSTALDLLDRELFFLAAENVVFEVDVEERHIRLDGMLRSDARATSPAVRIAFDSNQGPLSYATDAFARPSWKRGVMEQDWQHNVYAIAKSLEALRLVDRYGVTGRGEQYTGFKALPAGRAIPASHMTHDEALAILGTWGRALSSMPPIPPEYVNTDPEVLAKLHRTARRAAHPDRHDGDQTAWDQVEEAAAVLGVR